jgi:hypothetical protein
LRRLLEIRDVHVFATLVVVLVVVGAFYAAWWFSPPPGGIDGSRAALRANLGTV